MTRKDKLNPPHAFKIAAILLPIILVGTLVPAFSLPMGQAKVGMFLETWWCCGFWTSSNKPLVHPTLGQYESSDVAAIDQHLLWLRKLGISWIMFDLSNNPPLASSAATGYPLNSISQGMVDGVNAYIRENDRLRLGLSFTYLLGGGNTPTCSDCTIADGSGGAGPGIFRINLNGRSYARDWLNYIYTHWYNHMLTLDGKPWLSWYLGTPYFTPIPRLSDSRFTIRWVSGYGNIQPHPSNMWFIMNSEQNTVVSNNAPEIANVVGAYGDVCWSTDGFGRTFTNQWNSAVRSNVQLILISQWNDFKEGGSPDCANDIEPTLEYGYIRIQLVDNLIAAYQNRSPSSFTPTNGLTTDVWTIPRHSSFVKPK
jgi:hypothetical protein